MPSSRRESGTRCGHELRTLRTYDLMHFVARMVRGLEWVAAAEIEARIPDATRITLSPREVEFQTVGVPGELFELRSIDDIFLVTARVSEVGGTKAAIAPFATSVASLDWEVQLTLVRRLRDLTAEIRFDVVASIEGQHSYNRFDIENAVGALLSPRIKGQHLARSASGAASKTNPDLTIRIFLRNGEATVAVRLSSRPLHRRNYKLDTGAGTLHPPVAAALTMIAGLSGSDVVVDPFCGDGTVAIEAVLMQPSLEFSASDLDPVRVENARQNARRAGVDVPLSVADASLVPWSDLRVDAIVSNPPWNKAVKWSGAETSMDVVWRRARQSLLMQGHLCLISEAQLELPTRLTQLGYFVSFSTLIRLSGRLSAVTLASPKDDARIELSPALAAWQSQATALRLSIPTGEL